MWICIFAAESFLRRRLCLVVFMALAVITLTEAPRARAQDIVKGVNQTRNLELYYAAVTSVIPLTSALTEQLPAEDMDKKRGKSDSVGKRQLDQTTNLAHVNKAANVTVASDVNSVTKVNDRHNLEKERQRTDVYGKDEVVRNTDVTKERMNTNEHSERTTNKSKGKLLIALDHEVQQNIRDHREEFIPPNPERTLPLEIQANVLSADQEFINTANYDIYDFHEEDTKKEYEQSVVRTRKDTSQMEGVTWQSLQRLVEFATATNPDLSLINLVTPNPDIEITIEVLPGTGLEEYDGKLSSSGSELANEVTHTKSPGRKGKGKKGKGKKKKDKDRTGNQNGNIAQESTNIPGRQSTTSEEEKTNKAADNGEENESSYSYHVGGPLLPFIPDDFEDFNFPEDTFPMEEEGEWTVWSRCTASCGGGRTERSRSCGFSCTSTETQDCNQHPCPEIEYLDSQLIGGFQPVVETSSPTAQTTDQRYLDPSLTDFQTDSCEEWMSCRSEKLMSYLSRLEDLPNCPCFYPTTLHVNDMIWDKIHRKMFRWMISDTDKERLDVYKPSAKYCIRSLLTAHSTSLAAQQCCYDETMRLITRGPGAGTPKLISREISPELNYKIDILPWIICKGDWSKYNDIRQPNNGRGCREFPGDEAYRLYQEELKDF